MVVSLPIVRFVNRFTAMLPLSWGCRYVSTFYTYMTISVQYHATELLFIALFYLGKGGVLAQQSRVATLACTIGMNKAAWFSLSLLEHAILCQARQLERCMHCTMITSLANSSTSTILTQVCKIASIACKYHMFCVTRYGRRFDSTPRSVVTACPWLVVSCVTYRFVESRGQVPAGSGGQRGRRCGLQVQRVSSCCLAVSLRLCLLPARAKMYKKPFICDPLRASEGRSLRVRTGIDLVLRHGDGNMQSQQSGMAACRHRVRVIEASSSVAVYVRVVCSSLVPACWMFRPYGEFREYFFPETAVDAWIHPTCFFCSSHLRQRNL